MKLRIGILSVILFPALLLSMAVAQTLPHLTPFSADMEFSSRGARTPQEMNGKIYVNSGHLRMDMQSPAAGSVIITTFATQTSDVLMPQQHMYMEFKADQNMARRMGPSIKPFTDPNNPCANEQGTTCKNLGTEQVNGRSCDHWQITDKNGKVSNVWIDQKLHFPIKTVSEDATWQLTNIKEGEQPDSLFEVPSGYQKMDVGQMMQGMQGMRPPQQ